MIQKKFLESEFKKVNSTLATYFLTNFSFPSKFNFNNFSQFFTITIDSQTKPDFHKLLEYIDLLYKRKVIHDYLDVYHLLFMKYFDKKDVDEMKYVYDAIVTHSRKVYQLEDYEMVYFIDFYKLLDDEKYVDLCKEFLVKHKVVLKMEDLMNIMEVLENKDFKENPFILQLIQNSDVNIRNMIKNMNVPFDLLDIFIRDKNIELIMYLFRTYTEFLQYDNSLESLCQMKGIDISFLHKIMDQIKDDGYKNLPNFVDDENGVNFLIHKEDESLVLKYMNMVELQNYSNYLNHCIEKKMFKMVDYLCASIYRINPSYFKSIHFMEKVKYTTLFYKNEDYHRLNAIFHKYEIEHKKCDFVFGTKEVNELCICQICLEEENQDEQLLKCNHCKKLFHIHCIFEYMKSKQKEKIEEEEEELAAQNDIQIEYVFENEEEDEKEEDEKEEVYEDCESEEDEVEENELEEGENIDNDGYVGTYPIVEKDDIMCIYSKWYRKLKCVHCRQNFVDDS